MANELTINMSLAYEDSELSESLLEVIDKIANVSTKKFVHAKQAIGITEEAIGLGEVTAPGWALFINRDATNFINLKVATSGAIFAKLLTGECALVRLGSGAQAPYAIADTAPCQLEYLIVNT
jgi:hypothetical protein